MATTFGVIGTGWRSAFFCRLARMAPEHFRVTGVVSRSATSFEGVPVFGSIDALLRAESPDFVIVSVPWVVTPGVTRELVARGVRVLAETPPAPDLDGLRALWRDVGASGLVQVAEQNPFLPVLVALGRLVDDGVIGIPTSAWLSWTHGYHAVAVLRRL